MSTISFAASRVWAPLRYRIDRVAFRDSVGAFLLSRLIVGVTAVIAAAAFPPSERLRQIIPPEVHPFGAWPLGGAFDFVLSPLTRFDAFWYFTVAQHGYHEVGSAVFFPGYPTLVALLGFGSLGGKVVAAYAVSWISFAVALYVLHRLVALEVSEKVARRTVFLLALSPTAFIFSAPYSESLFLLLAVSAFYAARTRHWAWAGVLGAGASFTRSPGILLIAPLVLMYLYDSPTERDPAATPAGWRRLVPERAPSTEMLWIVLVVAGVAVFSVYLHHVKGDALAWIHEQRDYGRTAAAPWTAIFDGVRSAWQAISGTGPHGLAGVRIVDAGFLVFALAALVGVFRRLPIWYGAYTAGVLLLPLMDPGASNVPLESFDRLVLAAFPLFIWLAIACKRRWVLSTVVTFSVALLVFMTAAWVGWHPYT